MLVLLASDAFGPWARPVYSRAIAGSVKTHRRIAIVPTAIWPDGDAAFASVSVEAEAYFGGTGITALTVPLRERPDAYREEVIRTVRDASLVFFAGGHPEYVVSVVRGTPFMTAVLDALRDGVSVGGCSAGMWMWGGIVPDSSATSVAEHTYVDGLGVVRDSVLVPHWNTLDALLPGLQDDVVRNVPTTSVMVAAEDRTAVLGDGRSWRVFGEGRAVVEGSDDARVVESGGAFSIDRTPVCVAWETDE